MRVSTREARHRSRPTTNAAPSENYARAIKCAKKYKAKLRRRIERAEASGGWRKVREMNRLKNRSFNIRLAVADDVNRKAKPRRRVSSAKVHAAAHAVDAIHPRRGRANLHFKRKAGGGRRPIMDADRETRIIQGMVAADIEPWVRDQLRPCQFLRQGGRRVAVREALRHLGESPWVVNLDVKEFYPSCDAESLAASLPVPLRMARVAICASALDLQPAARKREAGGVRHPWRQRKRRPQRTEIGGPPELRKRTNMITKRRRSPEQPHAPTPCSSALVDHGAQVGRQEYESPTNNFQQGLVQGSPASVLVAEYVMANVLAALPEGTRVVCYADNITVFTHTEEEAIAVRDTLIRAIARGPAGNLRFGKKEVVRATEGFAFLGYELRVVRGEAVATPTDDNQVKIFSRFHRHVERQQYERARQCVRRWAAQFDLWPTIDEWLDWMLSEVDFAAGQSGCDDNSEAKASVTRAVTPNRTPPPRIRRRPIVNADVPPLGSAAETSRERVSPKIRLPAPPRCYTFGDLGGLEPA